METTNQALGSDPARDCDICSSLRRACSRGKKDSQDAQILGVLLG